MDKKNLSERDICTKYITPAILQAGWSQNQFREEVKLTDGRVMVRGTLALRIKNPDAKGGPKRADYVLYARPNLPIAVIEAKRNIYSVSHGMQQALAYAEMLDAPFALDALANAQSARKLKAAWLRVQEHLSLFLEKPEDVELLLNIINHLACRGLFIEGTIKDNFADENYPFQLQ